MFFEPTRGDHRRSLVKTFFTGGNDFVLKGDVHCGRRAQLRDAVQQFWIVVNQCHETVELRRQIGFRLIERCQKCFIASDDVATLSGFEIEEGLKNSVQSVARECCLAAGGHARGKLCPGNEGENHASQREREPCGYNQFVEMLSRLLFHAFPPFCPNPLTKLQEPIASLHRQLWSVQ